MKKILFIVTSILIIGFMFMFPSKSIADGTFSCSWKLTFGSDSCYLDTTKSNCSSGFDDGGVCNNNPKLGDCNKLQNQTCVAITSAGGSVTCDNETGIQTAIGCIHALGTTESFLGDILKWGIGIGGGIAFLLILYAGFMIMTSAGNPERLKAGQELLTSAIGGLLLLIFSIFVLKFIGIDILGLNNFGFGT